MRSISDRPAPKHEVCPGCGVDLMHTVRGVRYSRATLVEIRGVYDGGLFIAHTRQSGGCGFAWHRWEAPHNPTSKGYPSLHEKAEPYIKKWNDQWYEDPRGEDPVG